MPPIDGYSFYRNISNKEALELVKKDPREIQYIQSSQQTEQMQLIAVKKDIDLIIHIIKPTDKVKEYVLSNHPLRIDQIAPDELTEEDWQIAIMHKADVLRKWWYMYEDKPNKLPQAETWGLWLTWASKDETTTLRKLRRADKLDLIPLSIQAGLVFFLHDIAEDYLPNYKYFIKVDKHTLAKIAGDAQKGKFNEKKCEALLRIYS